MKISDQDAIDVEDIDYTIVHVILRSYTFVNRGNLVHRRLFWEKDVYFVMQKKVFTRNNITRVALGCIVYSLEGHSRNSYEKSISEINSNSLFVLVNLCV